MINMHHDDAFIDGLGNLHVEQMFQTTAEAEGKDLDPVKLV